MILKSQVITSIKAKHLEGTIGATKRASNLILVRRESAEGATATVNHEAEPNTFREVTVNHARRHT